MAKVIDGYGVIRSLSKVLALALACAVAFLPAHAGSHSRHGPVIVAFGDSLTHGYGLFDDEGFVPELRRYIAGQGVEAFRVINAGVSGDTTAGGLSRIDWTLTPDVDAVIVALGGNDLLRGIDPGVTRANIDGILTSASAAGVQVLLVGMQAPGNYGPEYQQAFNAIWPEMAEKHGTLLAPSFFVGLGDNPDPAALADLFQSDGIHPNAAGVQRVVAGLGPYVMDLLARVAEAGSDG